MKRGGIFEAYTAALKKAAAATDLYDRLFFYRHFSMNQFTIDLRKKAGQGETIAQTLERIGAAYRRRILG
jgi:hypothetical protein